MLLLHFLSQYVNELLSHPQPSASTATDPRMQFEDKRNSRYLYLNISSTELSCPLSETGLQRYDFFLYRQAFFCLFQEKNLNFS